MLNQNLTTSIWILWPGKTWGFIPCRFNSLALADGRSRRKANQKKFHSVPGKNEMTTVWLMDISKTLTWDVLTKILTSLYYSTSIWHCWILTVGRGLACPELLEEQTYIHFRKWKPFCMDAESNLNLRVSAFKWYHPYQQPSTVCTAVVYMAGHVSDNSNIRR